MSRRHPTPSKAAGNPADDAVPTIIVPKIGVPKVACPEPEAETEPVVSEMPADSVAVVNPAPSAEADTTSPAAADEPDAEKRAPSRALALYVLAVLLLALLEAGRLQTFLEQTELPGAVQAGAVVQDAAWLSGATLVANAEARLTRQLAVETVIGSIVETGRSLAALAAVTPATAAPAFVPPAPTASAQTVPAQTVPGPAVTPEIPVTVENAAKQPRHAAVPKVLIVGDSLIMEGLGPSLHRTLRKRTDITVVREGRYSTGLTRTDTFNWPDRMRELVAQHQPDIILVCLGANDSQDILVDGKRHIAGTPSWQALYRERADRFVAESTAQGATVIWLGLPIMGKPAYEKRIRLLSDLQEAACNAEPLCRFQNGMAPLADADGNYLAFVLDDNGQHVRLRYKDMIHVTEPGGQRLVDNATPLIDRIIEEVKTGAPDTPPTPVTPPSATPPVAPAVPATPGNPAIPPAAPAAPPAVPPAPSAPESSKNDAWDALLK